MKRIKPRGQKPTWERIPEKARNHKGRRQYDTITEGVFHIGSSDVTEQRDLSKAYQVKLDVIIEALKWLEIDMDVDEPLQFKVSGLSLRYLLRLAKSNGDKNELSRGKGDIIFITCMRYKLNSRADVRS
ncbi:hypothetical protein Syun_029540 [Stephania yunnanensis]|uniref:Uncharacterized protein n=1 Tax=Stephania yunnanensis TaxID=152371 RepID=A0AAP0E5T5_9MAGN